MDFLAAALAIIVCWAAVAAAQLDGSYDGYDPMASSSDVAAGSISTFPYRKCNASAGAYQLAPHFSSPVGGKYCFTIQVNDQQGCTGACCAADLKKIEFDVSDSCVVSPVAGVKATINGVPTAVGANYYRPATGPTTAAVLRLSFLGLDTVTARNAELCLTLSTNRAGKGCNTLEKMCVSPPGTPPGTCRAAFVDTSCKCCPVSQTFVPPPPSPPSTPSPSPLPPQPTPSPPQDISFDRVWCPSEFCIVAELFPPAIDVRPFRYDNASCTAVQQNIANSINAMIRNANISMKTPFTPDPTMCMGTALAVCGAFKSIYDLDVPLRFEDEVQAQLPSWIEVAAGGSVCSPALEGYTVKVSTSNYPCLNVERSAACNLPATPFPNCTCNTTQGILPFVISPGYFPGNKSISNTTAEYCFAINAIPQSQLVPSLCGAGGDKLSKIEWFANQNMSSFVRGFTLYPAVGLVTKLSPSWGAQGAYTLKATPINWSIAQASGGVVCVEIRKPKTMEDLCLGFGGQCYTTIFNTNKDCCPVYRTGLSAKF